MPEFNKTMRQSLRVALAKADITPAELAERSGVSYDSILNYLRGETVPLFETAYKLAEVLGCTPNDLCGLGR